MCNFIWREELRLAIHSFKRTGFFLRISLSYLFFHVGCFFWRSSCSHPFSLGLHWADNFWQQLLIKNNYFFGRRPSDFQSFKASLFISQFLLKPSILWRMVSAFVTERITVIHYLKVLYLFWWENLQSCCLSNSFGSNVYFLKKVGSSYAFYHKYYN